MVKRTKRADVVKARHGVEWLETRELLTTLLEGVAASDLTGTTVAPLGNIFDDSASGLVGDDFAISAPGARTSSGDIYIVFGGPHLQPLPAVQQGCIAPPTRVQSCSLMDTYLTNRVALRILGARAGDLAGYSVAGVGNVIGDSRPDVLIGAPGALNAAAIASGRAYLIGGEHIASVISAARLAGGTTVATINFGTVPTNCDTGPTVTIRCFDGLGDGDQAGNSVAGLGSGNFMIGAPRHGSAPKEQRGAAYVFTSLRGLTGGGTLTPHSTVLGPSFGAHLGGVPMEELAATGFRGYGVTGMRNPALIPVADEMTIDDRYDVLGGFEPDALVGAPDACVDNTCTTLDAPRNGLAYLLSGTGLITIGGTYDLSVDDDLKALSAIPVRGAGDDDRLGAAVSDAGDLDGDNISDFMFSAPDRDIPGSLPGSSVNNAGEVYVIFGREVNSTPFPDGQCQETAGTGAHQNFRQCRDATGQVVPIQVTNFTQPTTLVGLTLRGEAVGERAGVSIANAGNFIDPGGLTVVPPGGVGVSEILIGSPFRDLVTPTSFLPAAGRAYVFFGSRDYQPVSGQVRGLGLIDDSGTGQVFDGREANANYGISVNAAGNAHNPVGQLGGEILVGANKQDVTLSGAVALNVGEVELFFGSTGGPTGGQLPPISPFPFVQPGPFGPQVLTAGWYSFTHEQPPAGSIVQLPNIPTGISDEFLFPPYGPGLHQFGAVGPFVPAFPLHSPLFYPDPPLALVNRAGDLSLYGGQLPTSGGVNVTATLQSPKVKTGAAVAANSDGSIDVFAVDRSGHLIHHFVNGQIMYAVDLTGAAAGPTLSGGVSVQRVGSQATPSFIVSGRTVSGDLVVYAGSDLIGWGTANLTQLGGGASLPLPYAVRGRGLVTTASLSANYAINGSGHLMEYRAGKRGWTQTDITASARGPAVEGDVAANLYFGGGARATVEIFARGTDGHLIRYSREKRGWRAEDLSIQLGGGLSSQLTGAIMVASASFGQRALYAQTGSGIVEISSDTSGWRQQALPLPNGAASVIGPIAVAVSNGGSSRELYAYLSSGSLVQFRFDGTMWTSRVLDSTAPGASTLLDTLADLGAMSR